MAGATGGAGSSNPSPAPAPKILLAKPGLVTTGSVSSKLIRSGAAGGGGGGAEDESVSLRSRLPPIGSLNLLSDSWEFHTDRFLPLAGMLPPFAIQSEDIRAMARHCTVGIEPRISAERLILLDTQPVFSPSVLAEMMRPDGSSTISVLGGESLSSELAHELMGIQLGVLLASICHILLVISDGVHDINMWRLMLTVDLLKHGIPDLSSLTPSHSQNSNLGSDKEGKDKVLEGGEEYLAAPIFVHTKLRDQDITPRNFVHLRKALAQFFSSSTFVKEKCGNTTKEHLVSSVPPNMPSTDLDSTLPNLFLVPCKSKVDSPRAQYESYTSMLWKLRDQVLSMNCPSFARTISERDWLRNSAKIWELVKNSPIIAEYCKTLQSSGMFRRNKRELGRNARKA
ncbi:protein SMG9-like isoform X3 [Vitis riparia]|uniref:protein SMG9-like isoform X3 n=1 Tax=Vitis riparia TaxID=96939 RepID=UPI00155AED51|nr:protein SMG9-like isoform X3 [Vitis riparia]